MWSCRLLCDLVLTATQLGCLSDSSEKVTKSATFSILHAKLWYLAEA